MKTNNTSHLSKSLSKDGEDKPKYRIIYPKQSCCRNDSKSKNEKSSMSSVLAELNQEKKTKKLEDIEEIVDFKLSLCGKYVFKHKDKKYYLSPVNRNRKRKRRSITNSKPKKKRKLVQNSTIIIKYELKKRVRSS